VQRSCPSAGPVASGLLSAAKRACDTIEDETGVGISSSPISSNVSIARRRAPHCCAAPSNCSVKKASLMSLVDRLDDLTPLRCTLRDRAGNIDTGRGRHAFASSAEPSGCDAGNIVLASLISSGPWWSEVRGRGSAFIGSIMTNGGSRRDQIDEAVDASGVLHRPTTRLNLTTTTVRYRRSGAAPWAHSAGQPRISD
jgi:hypothetical protein